VLLFLAVPLVQALIGTAFTAVLTQLTVIDLRERLLPDVLTLPLILCGLLISAIGLGPPPLESAAGAAVGWGGLAALAFFYRRFRGFEGIGMGDAKLLGALGAWCGVLAIPLIVLGAASLGLTYYVGTRALEGRLRSKDELPFGPFLALAGWCAFAATRTEIVFLHLHYAVT